MPRKHDTISENTQRPSSEVLVRHLAIVDAHSVDGKDRVASQTAAGSPSATANASVSIVIDDPATRLIVVQTLRRAGFQTRSYGSAEAFLLDSALPSSPHCFLSDLPLSGIETGELLGHLQNNWPDAPVIFLSRQASVTLVVLAVKNGAYDVLDTPCRPAELIGKVRAAVAQCPGQSVDRLDQGGTGEQIGKLTPREREIFELLLDRRSTKEMALRLGISPRTVEAHRSKVIRKMAMTPRRNKPRNLKIRNAASPLMPHQLQVRNTKTL